jgi:hypothetical protein
MAFLQRPFPYREGVDDGSIVSMPDFRKQSHEQGNPVYSCYFREENGG